MILPNLCFHVIFYVVFSAHHHFRACVITETRKRCDGGQSGGAASRFSGQILDRALSFLQQQCQSYMYFLSSID